MANPCKVTIRSISTDGTNLFLVAEIFDGVHRLPDITPSFAVGTTATDIRAYIQAIADSQPTLTKDIADLVHVTISGQ